jgi:hypothetical protein
MEKGFKKLLGNRIYVVMPKESEAEKKLYLDSNTKEALEKEMLKTLNKLKIHTIGSGITDPDLIEGVYILVDPSALVRAPKIPLSKEESVLLVSPFDIIHIW